MRQETSLRNGLWGLGEGTNKYVPVLEKVGIGVVRLQLRSCRGVLFILLVFLKIKTHRCCSEEVLLSARGVGSFLSGTPRAQPRTSSLGVSSSLGGFAPTFWPYVPRAFVRTSHAHTRRARVNRPRACFFFFRGAKKITKGEKHRRCPPTPWRVSRRTNTSFSKPSWPAR